LLELGVRVLVIVGVVAPSELVDIARDRGEEVIVASQSFEVVAGLLQSVQGISYHDRSVTLLAHEEVLELQADLENISLRCGTLQLAAKDRARVVGPLLSLDEDVAGEAPEVLLPGRPE